ncbi:MAG TPA: hypothetical protein VFJ99_00715, partial [Solirubrobacterales bacterium]|nr:hypothetical protein [Solirubrobacterales bacterium]
ILNGFTFGRNVAMGSRFGRVPAKRPWQRKLDVFISIAVAIPTLVFAIPMELIAAALRRGSATKLSFELL